MKRLPFPWPRLVLPVIAVCAAGIIWPAGLVIRGSKHGYRWLRVTTLLWFLGAGAMASAVGFGLIEAHAWPYLLSSAFLSLAWLAERTASARIYTLLRVRFRLRMLEKASGTAGDRT
jgi:hypothetical protein